MSNFEFTELGERVHVGDGLRGDVTWGKLAFGATSPTPPRIAAILELKLSYLSLAMLSAKRWLGYGN